MSDLPQFPSAQSVTLDELTLLTSNRVQVGLQLEDGSRLWVEFMEDSEATRRLLELLGELTTRALNELGDRGVVVAGLTPAEEDEE